MGWLNMTRAIFDIFQFTCWHSWQSKQQCISGRYPCLPVNHSPMAIDGYWAIPSRSANSFASAMISHQISPSKLGFYLGMEEHEEIAIRLMLVGGWEDAITTCSQPLACSTQYLLTLQSEAIMLSVFTENGWASLVASCSSTLGHQTYTSCSPSQYLPFFPLPCVCVGRFLIHSQDAIT